MNAGGARHLREAHKVVLGLVRRRHHQVGQFINDHNDARQGFASLCASLCGCTFKVTGMADFKQAIAVFHLHDHPAQNAEDALDIRSPLCQTNAAIH